MNFVSDGIGAEIKLAASEPTKKRYEISVGGERLKVIESKWLDAAKNNAKLPGFRKGHVSEQLLLEQAGPWIREQVSREVLRSVVGEIVKRDNLKVVYYPVVSKVEYQFGERLAFLATFEVEPVLSLKNYKGLALERRSRKITDEEVASELQRVLEESQAQYLRPIEEGARENAGHWALVNMRCTREDSAEPVLEFREDLFSLEEEAQPAGFREAIQGMKAGASKTWQVPLDEDCPVPELRHKQLSFNLELLELKRLEKHSDDGLPQEVKDQIPKWKEELRGALTKRLEAKTHGLFRDQITGELLRENPMDVPEVEVDLRTQELLQRAQTIFALSGRQLSGEHDAELHIKYKIEAANEIRLSYLVREIARREGISVSEEDYKKRLESVADPKEKEWMLKHKESVIHDILNDKVFDILIANAKIEEMEV